LPTELSEAIVILRDCDKLKENAEHEANEIINDAHERAQMLVSESEITKEGERKAAEYVNNAGQFADNLVEQSYIQVNNMYIEVENVMRQMLDTVMASRESLFVPEGEEQDVGQQDPVNRTNEPRRG
jgi:cell division septum initiation protein DivIVA